VNKKKTFPLAGTQVGSDQNLLFILGPCVIENEEHTLRLAEELQKICTNTHAQLVFKASYDKANRSALSSYRGPGLDEGLRILEKVKNEFALPITTDVHTPEDAKAAGEVCDMIQIPAFLCRQTDLLIAAAQTDAVVNVKKGQFLAPWDMKPLIQKLLESGCEKLMLTDRGTCFGYNNLVSDMRSIPIMQELGCPVCFDATHSVQLPGALGDSTGGQREFIPLLARCAVAAGADAVFMETHPNPSQAMCDAASVLDLKTLEELIKTLQQLKAALHQDCLTTG
jgi:2-dehydro-3-deoxyphosphooctonate aldolase (KDO 8-P synthase)